MTTWSGSRAAAGSRSAWMSENGGAKALSSGSAPATFRGRRSTRPSGGVDQPGRAGGARRGTCQPRTARSPGDRRVRGGSVGPQPADQDLTAEDPNRHTLRRRANLVPRGAGRLAAATAEAERPDGCPIRNEDPAGMRVALAHDSLGAERVAAPFARVRTDRVLPLVET